MALDVASKLPSAAVGQPRTTTGVATFDLGLKERIDIELDTSIHTLERLTPGAPILAFTSALGAPRRSRQPVYYTIRTRPLRNLVKVGTGGYDGTTTTVPVSAEDGQMILPGYHIFNSKTREIMRVTAKPTATTLTVIRAFGTVSAAAGAANDDLWILGYRAPEGSDKSRDLSYYPESIYNYITKHHRTFEVADYEMGSEKRGENTRARLRAQHTGETRQVVEKGYLFDQRAKQMVDGKVTFVGNGLDAVCSENEVDFGNDITEDAMLAYAENLGRYGPDTRTGFASPRFMTGVNRLITKTTAPGPNPTARRQGGLVTRTLGVDIMEYQAGNLKFNFVRHPMFHDATAQQDNSLRGTCFFTDLNTLRIRTMSGRTNGYFMWRLNVETPGAMRTEDQMIVCFSLEYRFAEYMGRAYYNG